MAHEGGLQRLPPGGWWERKKQLPLYPFLPVQPLLATQSPFNTTSLVMPLAIIQNLQWFCITLRREYKVLSWPPKAAPGCSPYPSAPTELPDTPRLRYCSSLRLECRLPSPC